VLDWAGMESGTLPKKDFMIGNKFDVLALNEYRERKLISLLAQEVLDTEQNWINYEMEESEVKIDIADMIMENLVCETIHLLQKLPCYTHVNNNTNKP